MESIYLTAMRTRYRQLTGSDPGQDSDIGIRLALLAGQLDLLEEELTAVRTAMDPETAAGAALDRHAAARGLTRKAAVAAAGSLTFYRGTAAAEAIRLPAGLTAAAGEDGPRFATTEAGVLAAGETEVTLPAAALAPGRAGNIRDSAPGENQSSAGRRSMSLGSGAPMRGRHHSLKASVMLLPRSLMNSSGILRSVIMTS